MEGITAEQKYKRRAAIYLMRWNVPYATNVWSALRSLLDEYAIGEPAVSTSYISKAIRLQRATNAAFAEIVAKYKVTEQQLWALMIDQAESGPDSVDDLSDADAQISRLEAIRDSRESQLVHATLRASVASEAKLATELAVANEELKEKSAADTARNVHQRVRAQKPRNVLDAVEKETDVTSLIQKLATGKEYDGMTALELWQVFLGRLDELGASPVIEVLDKKRQRLHYQAENGERSMLNTSFASRLSQHRNIDSDPA